MVIKKGNKEFTVKENKTIWTVSTKYEDIDVVYNIPKETCVTEKELLKFVTENEMF